MAGRRTPPFDRTALVVLITVVVVLAPLAVTTVAGQTIRIREVSGNQIDVTISNAGGSTFAIDGEGMQGYNPSERNAGANVESIAMRLRQGGSYQLSLHYRPGTDPSTPDIDGVKALTKFNASHPDLANDNIQEATIRFGVRKSRLRKLNVGADDVVFYRLQDGTWEEHNVAQVEEEIDEYVFETALPGLSWLAIGVKQPRFEIMNPYLGDEEIGEGDEVTVFARASNGGTTSGTMHVTVTTEGTLLASRNVSLRAGQSRNLEIPISFDEIGEYPIDVNNQRAGTLRVVPAGEASDDDDGGDGSTDGGNDSGNGSGDGGGNGMPGFTAVAAALAAAGAAGLRRR